MPELHAPELIDTLFDALAADQHASAPNGLRTEDSDLARALVVLQQRVPGPDAETTARIWSRVLDSTAANALEPITRAAQQVDTTALKAPARLLQYQSWLARVAAALLIGLLGGSALLAMSPGAQAQARRLVCLVPGLGVRACDTPGLVSMQAVSATSNGLTAQVLGLEASADRTLVRLRLSGMTVPSTFGAGQDQRFRDSQPVVQDIQMLKLEVRDPSGQLLAPVAPGGPDWLGASPGAARSAQILYSWMEPAPDGTWRLAVTAEWAFGPLDPNTQSVDVVVPGPPGPVTVAVPLVPVQAAGLPVLGAEGAAVVVHGVPLRITGITNSTSGLTLELAARGPSPSEHVVGLGEFEPGRPSPVLGRVLVDSQGHLHADVGTGPAEARSEGGSYFQTLTFQALLSAAVPRTLEVPSVFLVDDTASASVTIPVDGRLVGDHIAIDAELAFGPYPLRVEGASIEAADGGRELVVDVNQGDVNDGRALLGSQTIQVSGRDDLRPHVTQDNSIGPRRHVHVPLPLDIGPQVTLTFSGALVEVRGPWQLPVPSAGVDQ